jgi:hypothetical protein
MAEAQRTLVPPAGRVSDKVLQTFEYACAMRDSETAAQLLAILEDIANRKVLRFGGDRRLAGIDLDSASERLRNLEAECGRNPAHPASVRS